MKIAASTFGSMSSGTGKTRSARDHEQVGVAATVVVEDDHPLADLELAGGVLDHPPRGLEAGGEVERLFAPVLAAADHRVAEVDADRLDLDHDLVGAGRGRVGLDPAHHLGPAEFLEGDESATARASLMPPPRTP